MSVLAQFTVLVAAVLPDMSVLAQFAVWVAAVPLDMSASLSSQWAVAGLTVSGAGSLAVVTLATFIEYLLIYMPNITCILTSDIIQQIDKICLW